MDAGVIYWERRDGADRTEVAMASLRLCQALKGADGVQDARLYFSKTDCPTILIHLDSVDVLDRVTYAPAVSAAHFALGDLARHTGTETWLDAANAEKMFNAGH